MNNLENFFKNTNKLTGDNIVGLKVDSVLTKLLSAEFVYRGKTYEGVYVLGTDLKETSDGRYLDDIELDPSTKVEQSIPGIKDFWKTQYPPFKGDKVEVTFVSQIGDFNEKMDGFLDIEEDGTPVLLDKDFNKICLLIPSYDDEEISIRKLNKKTSLI